jgi:hypothetical protein
MKDAFPAPPDAAEAGPWRQPEWLGQDTLVLRNKNRIVGFDPATAQERWSVFLPGVTAAGISQRLSLATTPDGKYVLAYENGTYSYKNGEAGWSVSLYWAKDAGTFKAGEKLALDLFSVDSFVRNVRLVPPSWDVKVRYDPGPLALLIDGDVDFDTDDPLAIGVKLRLRTDLVALELSSAGIHRGTGLNHSITECSSSTPPAPGSTTASSASEAAAACLTSSAGRAARADADTLLPGGTAHREATGAALTLDGAAAARREAPALVDPRSSARVHETRVGAGLVRCRARVAPTAGELVRAARDALGLVLAGRPGRRLLLVRRLHAAAAEGGGADREDGEGREDGGAGCHARRRKQTPVHEAARTVSTVGDTPIRPIMAGHRPVIAATSARRPDGSRRRLLPVVPDVDRPLAS